MNLSQKNAISIVRSTCCFCLIIVLSLSAVAQKTLDAPIPLKHMRADLELFRSIREAANSGVYKYRTNQEIDSVYQWAQQQLEAVNNFRGFYNLLWTITDFEGSLHNGLYLPPKVKKAMRAETTGYFPIPLKVIQNELRVNSKEAAIPLGAKILSVNGISSEVLIKTLGKYYTTDGFNLTGKEIGINSNFATYYRLAFGLSEAFQLEYETAYTDRIQQITLKSVAYRAYWKAFAGRHSKAFDSLSYESDESPPYRFKQVGAKTGLLSISSFSIGWNENHPKHKAYVHFLDSIFQDMQNSSQENLIVDVRHNGGGSDPNDLVTYSYLTDRSFSENKEAWVTFRKPPYWRYNKEVRLIGKFLEKRSYIKIMEEDFPEERNGNYYQNETSDDHLVREPNDLAFRGNVYLLVSPRTASAGSLFAAMVAGNHNTTVIGRETQGGYYGHNGHVPIRYRLPHSKIKFMFSLVNLEQDVPQKANQPFGSGIMPDHEVEQTLQDFLDNRDAVMEYTLKLIQSEDQVESSIPSIDREKY